MRTIPSGPRPGVPGRLLSSIPSAIRVLPVLACGLMLAAPARAGVVPVVSPFYAGAEQTDDRMIYVGGSGSGGKLAIDNHAEFMVARDDSNVARNWCNGGTFKWSFGFFGFDGPDSEYPLFEANVGGSPAVTFDGGDKMRMILEPGFGYTLPSEITDGVLSVEMWIQNPSVQAGEVLIRFEDSPNLDLTVDNFSMSGGTSWQHLVAVSNGTQTSYYLNGSHVTTQAGALSFSDTAVINLGAQSFTGSIAAIRVHTEEMNTADISHNYTGGVGLGTYLFYPIHDTDIENSWYGDPDRSVDPGTDLRWHESAHFRSMWDEAQNPNPGDDIGARIQATQLDKLETVYTYMNEKSGKHLPLVSNDENKRGDGRKYKWIVGNGWGGAWSGWSPFGLGFGIFYAGYDNPHEYVHGTDGHQMSNVTGHWYETHANFQVSWLGSPQANPVTNCPGHAHVYPSTGGNYYHAYPIWDHLVETPEFGGLYVTRLWNRGPNSGDGGRNYPPKGMEEMDPSPGTPFNEEWVKMAARNITWDYPSHPEYATVWAGQEYKTRKHFTLLQDVPYLAAGWYEPPKWRTPQQHGYNICALEPNQGTVTADLTGHIDSARGSAWSAMFVAVDNGTPRYGNVFANGTQGIFTVQSGDDELYLVVVATPTNILEIGIFSNDGITDYRGAPKDRFPYQVQLGGTTPKATAWMPSAANNGTVDPTAYVSPNAYIAPGAQVLENARVEDYAQVYGTVSGNAVVSGFAYIESNATVSDNALVGDYAIIRGGSSIFGNARVLEHADIHGVDIYDYAVCKGNSNVSGPIHGNAMIDGNYIKNGEHSTGYQFLWAWGDYLQDGETYQDFGGLFLEYQFEQQNGYRVWDTHGATWARLINGASYASDNAGTVLDLDGVDQFVDLHSSVATSIDVSFVVDVKWDGGANGQRIFEFSNPNGDVCWLSPSDDQGKLSFGIKVDGDEQVVRAASPLPTGVWKTVSVVMFDDTAIVQIDGLDWGSNDAFTHDVRDVSASVCYLGRGTSGGYFDGRMDNFTIWSRSLIDLNPPTPDPAEFVVEPVSVTETEVAMFAKPGTDAGGNVEYNFEEALGGTGADDSGWQGSRKYWDEDLDSGVSEYVYRVTMRDGSGNMTDSSAVTRLTWQTTNKVYSQADDATGLAVIEAENYGRKAAGINGYEWELNTGAAGYLGTGAMMVPNSGTNNGVDYDVKSPRLDYFIDFAKTGNHWVWVRAHGSSPNDDSYHLGDDMHASGWGNYQAWGTWNIYHWMRKGPFNVDSTGVHTINLWMREDGTRIDRLLVTSDGGYVPTAQTDGQGNVIGDGPAESASVTRTMLFKAALTDNTAPTPDAATFAINPAGVSGYIISMTATTGTDASGQIEYYFEETSGALGGTDSGWQSSATYSDSQLTPDTSYSYRVRMRDIYGNTTGWSATESASTTNEVDDQPPTPNVAQFDVAPYATFAQELTMTAVVGTDVNGPVEYYFTETSGAPGGSNSGWQSSPTYTDDGLSVSTQYTYTVMMRDGLGNIGTASAPVSGTTSSDKLPLFSLDHDNLPGVGASVETWDGFTKSHGTPTVVALGGEKWYSNDKATSDGMRSDLGNHAAGTSIPINGATIVTAVRPERYTSGNWCLVVDIFYDQLCLGINNQSGAVTVKISGASGANHQWQGGVIPEEPGVLSLTVANTANPAFEVFWRGANDPVAVSMGTGNGNTGGEPYTALYAQANGRSFAGWINIGRNNPDGWSTYNGLIGDTHVFDEQLSAAALLTVQDAVRAAMGISESDDTDPPTPDPATFANAPTADSDTAISMTATTGTDASGPVQYYFDETTGNPGGTDSGWQTSASYTDTGLDPSTLYTYTVQMRDNVPNIGTASAPSNATTQAPPETSPPTPNPAAFVSAPAAISATAISMTAVTGSDPSGPVEYFFDETSGNPGGTDSGWQTSASYTDSGLNPSTLYTYTVQMRDSVPNIGTASAPSNATTQTDTSPPTPNPAAFVSAPAAISDTAISMTAVTGSDPSGPVEYFFNETTGNLGGTDSGWQTSASYTDTGLNPSTLYTYTVQMRDSVPNTGTASAPSNATTQATSDTSPPTPNPAAFVSAPAAISATAISMTAVTGSDPSGPVEYFFNETSGNPGGTDSGWQTSASYTDSGLDPSTLYAYTVQMRDSVPNTGTASAPSNATTDVAGSSYRLVFVTSTNVPSGPGTAPGDVDMDALNAWVTGLAQAPGAVDDGGALGTTWSVIGATSTVNVFDNTDTEPGVDTDTPIYLVDGTLFAANLAAFWASASANLNVNEQGGSSHGGSTAVHTGLNSGPVTATGNELDAATMHHGGMDSGYNPWYGGTTWHDDDINTTALFAISGVIAATDPDDTDGDGLADLWEDEHFGNNDRTPTPAELAVSDGSGDFDGDGTPDLAEFRLGLIPSDPNSAFKADISQGLADTVALSWPSQDGLQFEIYFTDDLNLPLASWNVIQVTDDDGDGSPRHEWTDADAASYTRRFYRVGLLP